MHVTGIQEQLGVVRGGHKVAGRVHVALPGEDGICVHAVDLHRHTVRPCVAELTEGDAGVDEDGSPRPGVRLGELLGGMTPIEIPM